MVDGSWRYVHSDDLGTIVHQRRDNSRYKWTYSTADDSDAPVPCADTLSADVKKLKWIDDRVIKMADQHRSLDFGRAEIIVALANLVHGPLHKRNRHAFTREELFRLLNKDVSERDASLCLMSSRMCVANPYSVRGHMTSTGIPFEGFLEALVRLSCLKALPTDEEIADAGQETAASFLSWLAQEDEMRLMKIIGERGTPFGAEPPQPPERCVDHLISIIVREILDEANATKKTLKVSIGEVRTWWRQHGGK